MESVEDGTLVEFLGDEQALHQVCFDTCIEYGSSCFRTVIMMHNNKKYIEFYTMSFRGIFF